MNFNGGREEGERGAKRPLLPTPTPCERRRRSRRRSLIARWSLFFGGLFLLFFLARALFIHKKGKMRRCRRPGPSLAKANRRAGPPSLPWLVVQGGGACEDRSRAEGNCAQRREARTEEEEGKGASDAKERKRGPHLRNTGWQKKPGSPMRDFSVPPCLASDALGKFAKKVLSCSFLATPSSLALTPPSPLHPPSSGLPLFPPC